MHREQSCKFIFGCTSSNTGISPFADSSLVFGQPYFEISRQHSRDSSYLRHSIIDVRLRMFFVIEFCGCDTIFGGEALAGPKKLQELSVDPTKATVELSE